MVDHVFFMGCHGVLDGTADGVDPQDAQPARFLAAALKAKDRISVYAVNPRYDEIMGVKSYPSVTNLPEALDLVGIVVIGPMAA